MYMYIRVSGMLWECSKMCVWLISFSRDLMLHEVLSWLCLHVAKTSLGFTPVPIPMPRRIRNLAATAPPNPIPHPTPSCSRNKNAIPPPLRPANTSTRPLSPLPLTRHLPRLDPPERIIPARALRPRKLARAHNNITPRHDRVALDRRVDPRPVRPLRRRQLPSPALLGRRLLRRDRVAAPGTAAACAGGQARRIVVSRLEQAVAVVVAALEDWAGPFGEHALGLALDAQLELLALRVEQDYFAKAAGD